MLKEQATVGYFPGNPPAVHRSLRVPALDVVHGVRSEAGVRENEFIIHDIEITTRVTPPRRLGTNQIVINEADLRAMSPGERRKLAHALATVDYPHPFLGIYVTRSRRLGALASIIACTVLIGWIIVLVLTLNRTFHAQHWRLAWIGFDLILLAAFAATGWAFWRGRQIVIVFLIITSTLLCCDAWFDVVLDAGTPDVWVSVASAAIVELPLAAFMFNAARRLIRLSAVVAVGETGDSSDCVELPPDSLPPLWKIPLFGQRLPVPAAEEIHTSTAVDRRRGADLPSSPWLPISPRKPPPTRWSSRSRRRPIRGCARSSPRSCATCTRSPATSS